MARGISAETFYGPKSAMQVHIEEILDRSGEKNNMKSLPDFMTRLLGPSRTWKIFRKQQEAISYCLQRRNGLMCFAFEQKEGQRLFLVAHPKVFWAVNSHRFFKDCSTYEIIQEYAVCKLYFDIEYEYGYNSESHNGDRMLNTLLHIVNFNLHDQYGISCKMDDILNLESSNIKKYSHHIVYQIHNVAFKDNYAIGNFVKRICNELRRAYDSNASGDKNDIVNLAEKYKLTVEDILELFVYDNKRKVKLLVDEGVYTKNRHFRLLGSTKLNKNSPLVISENNMYKPQSKESYNLSIFLDSLVTYFSTEVDRILECDSYDRSKCHMRGIKNVTTDKIETLCPFYPEIDDFIKELIIPNGGIRKKAFFNVNSRIIYDIFGYRYCDNIKRHHKSNNIMYIIDLHSMTYYQKCHDPDCLNFKSASVRLPEKICFLLEDDKEFMDNSLIGNENSQFFHSAENNELSEYELSEIMSCIEDLIHDPEFCS